jgi:hypothetical protein
MPKLAENEIKTKFMQVHVSEEAHRLCKMASVFFKMRMEEVVDAALRLYAREFQLDEKFSSMVFKTMYPGAEEKINIGRK